jgi:hypothetical protein
MLSLSRIHRLNQNFFSKYLFHCLETFRWLMRKEGKKVPRQSQLKKKKNCNYHVLNYEEKNIS